MGQLFDRVFILLLMIMNKMMTSKSEGYAVARLRHCTPSWKAAGSIPNGVIGIFYLHNPSGCPMALGLTQPLTEMSTGNISCRLKAAGALG